MEDIIFTGDDILTKDRKYQIEMKIQIYTTKLNETDYIAAKISEAQLVYQVTQDDTKLLELYEKYKDVINQRELWREEIREKELELKQLKEKL